MTHFSSDHIVNHAVTYPALQWLTPIAPLITLLPVPLFSSTHQSLIQSHCSQCRSPIAANRPPIATPAPPAHLHHRRLARLHAERQLRKLVSERQELTSEMYYYYGNSSHCTPERLFPNSAEWKRSQMNRRGHD